MDLKQMGRRDRKKLQTHRAIRSAAIELFEEHGYENVTVEQIADTADVSTMTFYRYFKSKEAVITNLVQADALDDKVVALFGAEDFEQLEVGLKYFFETVDLDEYRLAESIKLMYENPALRNMLWQFTTVWVDALAGAMGDGLQGRIKARCVVGAIAETLLAWPEAPNFPAPAALHSSLEKSLREVFEALRAMDKAAEK